MSRLQVRYGRANRSATRAVNGAARHDARRDWSRPQSSTRPRRRRLILVPLWRDLAISMSRGTRPSSADREATRRPIRARCGSRHPRAGRRCRRDPVLDDDQSPRRVGLAGRGRPVVRRLIADDPVAPSAIATSARCTRQQAARALRLDERQRSSTTACSSSPLGGFEEPWIPVKAFGGDARPATQDPHEQVPFARSDLDDMAALAKRQTVRRAASSAGAGQRPQDVAPWRARWWWTAAGARQAGRAVTPLAPARRLSGRLSSGSVVRRGRGPRGPCRRAARRSSRRSGSGRRPRPGRPASGTPPMRW